MEGACNTDKTKLLQSAKKIEHKKRRSRSQPPTSEIPEKTLRTSQHSRQDMRLSQPSSMDTSDLVKKWQSLVGSQSMCDKEVKENLSLQESKRQIARANTEIQRLKDCLEAAELNEAKSSSTFQVYQQSLEQMIEKLKLACEYITAIQEYVNDLAVTKEECEEAKIKVKELYDNTILKQKERIQELSTKINKLNEDVIKEKKTMQAKLEEKISELLHLQEDLLQATHNTDEIRRKLQEIENVLQMKETELQSLNNNITIQMKKISELEIENGNMMTFNQGLKTSMTDEMNKITELYKVAQAKIAEEKSIHDEEKKEFNRKYKELQSLKENTERQLEKLTKDLSEAKTDHERTISELHSEIADYRKNMIEVMNKSTAGETENKKLTSKIEELAASLTEAQQIINQSESNLNAKCDEISKLETQRKDIEEKNFELSVSMKQFEQKLKGAEEKENDMNNNIRMLENKLKESEIKYKNLLAEHGTDKASMIEELEKQRGEVVRLREDIVCLQREKNITEVELSDIQQKNIQLSDSVEQLEHKAKAEEEKKNEMRKDMDLMNNKIQESEVKYKKLLTEHETKKTSMIEESNKLRNDIAELKENVVRIKREKNKTVEEYEEKILYLKNHLGEVESAKDKESEYHDRQLKKLKEELAEQRKKNESSTAHITRMDAEYSCEKAKLQTELQSVNSKVEAMKTKHKELTAKMSDDAQLQKTKFVKCQDELNALKETQKKSDTAYKDKMKELSEQRHKYDELKAEYEAYKNNKESEAKIQTMPRTSTPKSILKSPEQIPRPPQTVQFNFSDSSESSIDAMPLQEANRAGNWLHSDQISSTEPSTVPWPPRNTSGRAIRYQAFANRPPPKSYKGPAEKDSDNPFKYK